MANKKHTLLEKAWHVWVPEIEIEGQHPIEYASLIRAQDRKEAILKSGFYTGQNPTGKKYHAKEIKACRASLFDLYLFKNQGMTLREIAEEIHKDKWLKVLNELPEEWAYYIQKTGSYVGNMVVWWGVDSKGYTTYIEKAGQYTKQQVIEICSNQYGINMPWPVRKVIGKASLHIDHQNLDYSDAIKIRS